MRASEFVLYLVLGFGGCACSGQTATDSGPDAGQDAGHDAARDAGRDAGEDAARADGGWLALGAVPADCELYIASPQQIAATQRPPEACADRAGCRRIVTPGGPAGAVAFRVERGHGIHDGVRGLVTVVGDVGVYREAWILDDAGHAVVGLRTRNFGPPGADYCVGAFFDVSATHLTFDLLRAIHPDGLAEFLYRGALTEAPQLVGDLLTQQPGGWTQEIRIDGIRTASWRSTQIVYATEADGSTVPITPDVSAGCEIADVIGDAIFSECGSPPQVFVQLPGGAHTPLLDPTHRNWGLDSDGTDMAWVRYVPLDGGGATEVWASPHATDPAMVVERHVADVPFPASGTAPSELRVGFGHAALLEQPDVIGVYRLADGARAELRAPAGEAWTGFVQYIGPVEIAVTTGDPTATVPLTDLALMFIRLDSLTFVPP